jgi:hypothetical protein
LERDVRRGGVFSPYWYSNVLMPSSDYYTRYRK